MSGVQMAEASRRARAAKPGNAHDTAMTEGADVQWTLGAGAGGGVWDRAARWRQADRQAAGKENIPGKHSQQVPALQSKDRENGLATARPVQKQSSSNKRVQPFAPCDDLPGRQLAVHELSGSQGASRQSTGFTLRVKRAPNFSRLHAAWSARLASAKAAVQRGLTNVQVSPLHSAGHGQCCPECANHGCYMRSPSASPRSGQQQCHHWPLALTARTQGKPVPTSGGHTRHPWPEHGRMTVAYMWNHLSAHASSESWMLFMRVLFVRRGC